MQDNVRSEPTLVGLPADEPGHDEPLQDQQPSRVRASRRRRRARWILGLIAVLAIVALASVLLRPKGVIELSAPAVTPAAPRTSDAAPLPPRYPVPVVEKVLPPLDGSDAALLGSLQTLWPDGGGILSYLEPRDLVRNFVATVDNLPRRNLGTQRGPMKRPVGTFGVGRSADGMVIDAANAVRYRAYVTALDSVDMPKLAQLYVTHYPLFQQAYRDLGYPSGHFNDRLVEAIDVLLSTPEQHGDLKLVQPKIFYEYADRGLEQLPSGQKLLLRMGPDNARAVKGQLVRLRALITAQAAPPR